MPGHDKQIILKIAIFSLVHPSLIFYKNAIIVQQNGKGKIKNIRNYKNEKTCKKYWK
ncbi:hypothetical protein LDG_9023 [Legionella drancourtii LLAP12]|uniref:Uncharacterized protein n=1 Tax=Legionella drancourtii LLAP12 TaxID=658187 RepID=G9EUM5_9GAMM|nr:hypothetical protein LDG_9023 [Legionella drancourtii LLAP12]